MKRIYYLVSLLLTFIISQNSALATTGNSTGGADIFWGWIGLGFVALLSFGFYFSTGGWMVLKNQNISINEILPGLAGLFGAAVPRHAQNAGVKKLSRGFDIKLEGAAEKKVVDIHASSYAVQPGNFRGIAPIPKLVPQIGDEVLAGDEVFFDKNNPDIRFVSPVSGEIAEIKRGEKRAIASIVIVPDKENKFRTLPSLDIEKKNREEIVAYLLKNGFWPHINKRPYDVIADPADVPDSIFISTFDTAPLAPDLSYCFDGDGEAFQKGLDVLDKLTSGKIYLGLDGNRKDPPAAFFAEAKGVEKNYFQGKHPSGNVGVQIHHISSLKASSKVWTLQPFDVVVLGRMILEQKYDTRKLVAITGSGTNNPSYVRTYPGAQIGALVGDSISLENPRIISGDVLTGEKKSMDGYLNLKDDQITIIEEGDYFEFMGWLLPFKGRPSASRSYPNFLFPNATFKGDTNTHGEKRAFVVTGQYEKVLPMDIYLQHLMKAILVNDFERMEGLGIYELSEEDVALCEFVCTSKMPLQQILRQGLDIMREQS